MMDDSLKELIDKALASGQMELAKKLIELREKNQQKSKIIKPKVVYLEPGE